MSTVRWYSVACTGLVLVASLVGGCAQGDDESDGSGIGGSAATAGTGGGGTGGSSCVCQPGEQVQCACAGGGMGTQVCQSDCMSFAACDCSGGTGGTGGTGTGGTGGTGTGGTGTGGTGGTGTGGTGGTGTGGTGATGGTGGTGTGGTGGTSGDADVCPGEEIVLTGTGDDPRTGSASGSTVGMGADYIGTSCGSSQAADAVYVFTPDVDGHATIDLGGSTSTSYDSVLYARTDCADDTTEIKCDDVLEEGGESIDFDAIGGTSYYVFVDGYNLNEGPYTVNVAVVPKGCGNGIQETGEDCDDGNDIDNDWCKNDCTVNPTPAGDTCPGVTMAMTGTGTQDRVGTISGDTTLFSTSFSSDACGSSQTPESNDIVAAVTSDVDGTMICDLGGSTVTPFDAVLYVRSTCDDFDSELDCSDSATAGGDEIEIPVAPSTTYYVIVDGWGAAKKGPFELTCTIKPAYCSNGEKEGTEECDDGNLTDGDGCDSSCNIEPQGPADVCPGTLVPLIQTGSMYFASFSGSTTGQTPAYEGSCGSAATAPDQVYQFNSGVGGNVTVNNTATGTDFNTVLYVREGVCSGPGATQVDCENSTYGDGNEKLEFQAPPNTNYWLFVDGYSGANGSYSIELTIVPTCGDGTLDVGEACDDGNKSPGDGCAADCTIEATCGNVNEGEPNPYDSPTMISASCGTFRIPSGSITPVGDSDHYRINGLVAGAEVEAYAYVGSPGTCPAGTVLAVSLWESPISSAGADYGSCSPGQDASEACSDSGSNGNCAELNYTIPAGGDGDYIVKVHSQSSITPVPAYGLTVTVR